MIQNESCHVSNGANGKKDRITVGESIEHHAGCEGKDHPPDEPADVPAQ